MTNGYTSTRFSDGSRLMTFADGHSVYVDRLGYKSRQLTQLQMIHQAQQSGQTRDAAVAALVDGKGDAIGAYEAHKRQMADAWRQ